MENTTENKDKPLIIRIVINWWLLQGLSAYRLSHLFITDCVWHVAKLNTKLNKLKQNYE